jgi:hypothetical protein
VAITAVTGASSTHSSYRIAAIAGIASIVLAVVGAFVDQMVEFPGTGASAGEIMAFLDAHRSALLVAMVLNATAVTLWLVFAVGVWRWLRESGCGESASSFCFLVGFVTFVTLLLAGFALFFVLVYRAPAAADPRVLYALGFGVLAVSGLPTALALGAYTAHVWRAGELPTWTGLLAVVAALAHVALPASLVIRSGFLSLEGGVVIAIPATLFAWIVGMSVAMMDARRVS